MSNSYHFFWRTLLAGGSLLVLGSIGCLTWWFTRPSPIHPPIPAEINDPEVIRVIQQAQKQLLAKPTASNWGYLGMLLTSHQYDSEALICYREAQARDPGDSRWPYLLGLSINKRDPSQGLDLLQKAIKCNTWPAYHFSMTIALIERLIERNRIEEAEILLQGIKPEAGDRDRLLMTQAWLALQRGENEAAREFFGKIRNSPFARHKATAQLAALARLANQPDEAARLERDLLEIPMDQEWPDPLINEIIALRVGRLARENRIKLLEEKHQYQEAASLYLKELEIDRSIKNLLGAGQNQFLSNNHSHAKALLTEAIQLDPQNARARHLLSMCLYSSAVALQREQSSLQKIQAEFRECEKQAGLALVLKPNLAHACLIRGLALKNLTQFEDAVEALKQGITYRPETFDLQFALAEVLVEQKKYDEAKRHLNLAIQADGKDPRGPQLMERIEQASRYK